MSRDATSGGPRTIAVIGPGSAASPLDLQRAEAVGRLLAEGGHIVLNGGLGGVMEAVSRGAAGAGGTVVGYLPGLDRSAGNRYLTVALPTGLGELRNGLIVRGGDAVIGIGCSWGTLSEIALAVRTGVPVVLLGGWDLPAGPRRAEDPAGAVAQALRLAGRGRA